jgi:hypothetical protein
LWSAFSFVVVVVNFAVVASFWIVFSCSYGQFCSHEGYINPQHSILHPSPNLITTMSFSIRSPDYPDVLYSSDVSGTKYDLLAGFNGDSLKLSDFLKNVP